RPEAIGDDLRSLALPGREAARGDDRVVVDRDRRVRAGRQSLLPDLVARVGVEREDSAVERRREDEVVRDRGGPVRRRAGRESVLSLDLAGRLVDRDDLPGASRRVVSALELLSDLAGEIDDREEDGSAVGRVRRLDAAELTREDVVGRVPSRELVPLAS